jgi:hypothetical protein
MAITTEDGVLAGFQPPSTFFKGGITAKAAGTPVAMGFAAAGVPPAFAPASPGLAGATVIGTSNTLGGTFPFINPIAGNTYLAKVAAAIGTATCALDFFDFLWYNTGIVVTTTTAQTVNSVTLPARDATGTSNGVGVTAWLYCSTATTNSAGISNTTITYTNAAGVTGRTGTMISGWPATATAGTFVPFALQIGDTGIQSIQSITLGTSYVSGAVNLVMIRDISYVGFTSVSSGMTLDWAQLGFPQLYNGTALSFWIMPTGTGITTVAGHINFSQG